MPRVLVIEDEADLQAVLEYNLKSAGYDVRVVGSGGEGIRAAREDLPDLVLLDLMLPDISGLEVCRTLKGAPETRDVQVMMVTAKGEEIDRVVGFELGADDYITKPFSPRELVLRVGAVLRRAQAPQPDATAQVRITIGRLVLDVPRHRVTVDDEEVPLTALEFKLLLDLATRRGRVQSRDALLDRVWGYAPGIETRTVDTHVKRLRAKLGDAGHLLETLRGVGYRLRDPGR